MRIRRLGVAVVAAVASLSSVAGNPSFTPGNIVVLRVGDGVAALSTASAAAFLDEYTTAGVFVQSIALPTVDGGANQACTVRGSTTIDGLITRSTDGSFLVGGCYDAPVATAAIEGTTSAATPRVLYRVNAAGIVDSSTFMNNQFSGGALRSVASVDGSRFWAGGSVSGIVTATYGATTGTAVSTTVTNNRATEIYDNQLYASNLTGANARVQAVGTGLPTGAGTVMTGLAGLPTATSGFNQFFLADLDAGVAGVDTLYAGDDGSNALRKYSLVGGTWTAIGTQIDVGSAYRGLTASVAGSTVTLFATKAGNTLVTVTDTAGYNAAPSAITVSTLATAAANTAFRGVAFVPQASGGTPALSIAAAPTIAEGNSGVACSDGSNKLVFPVTAVPTPAASLAFTATVSAGTATAVVDIGTLATVNVNTSGNGSVEVPVNCDLKIEGDETVEVTLQAGAGYTLATAVATSTINNDDNGDVRIASVAQVEGTGANSTFAFSVTMIGGVLAGSGGVSVDYDVVAAGGTPATLTTDFTGASGTLTIAEDANSGVINVTVIADSDDEPDETFAVNLSNPVNAIIGDNQAIGTIQNDDSAVPQISINDVTLTEGDSGTQNAVFTVSMVPAPVGTVTVDYATADGLSNPATAASDYLVGTGTLSFDALNTTRQVTVVINGDTAVEANETYFVNLSNIIGSGAFAGGDAQGLGTISNDDFSTTLSVPATLALAEGNGGTSNASVVISADVVPQGGAASVSYATAGVSATAGTDFTGSTGTATIVCAAGPALPCNATVNVPIIGDLFNEPDETFTLTISSPVGTNIVLGNAVTTVTISNDDTVPELTIAQIQGDGSASPVPAAPNNVVTSFGNVVTQKVSNGFYMQMPVGDGDLETSDAIFVFTGAAHPALAGIAVGDLVDVRGPIVEFFEVTEFTTASGLPIVTETGTAALPAPFVLDNAMPSPLHTVPFCDPNNDLNVDPGDGQFVATDKALTRNLECLEFMRVTTSTGVVNGANQQFGAGDPYAEMYMTAGGVRVFRDPGVAAVVANENVAAINLTPPPPPLPTLTWDGNPELFELDVDKFFPGAALNVLSPGTTFTANGLLGFEFDGYEFWVTPNVGNTEADLSVNVAGPVLPVPVPTPPTTELTIGSLNVLRLFDYCDDPGATASNEPVNIADTDRKIAKLSVYIRDVMKSPDVIGIQETEIPSAPATVCVNGQVTTPALQLLANKISADGGPTYTAYHSPQTNDIGRISIGFLVRAARFTVDSVTQLRLTEQWTFTANATPSTTTLHDRPPLLLQGTTTVGNGGVLPVAVMANHLRSLGRIDDIVPEPADPTPTSDQENAHRVRRKRLFQAVAVACEAQTFQTANPTTPLILVGDYNAFEFSDGYVDSTGIIRGDTNPANSEYDIGFDGATGGCPVQPSGQIVSPAFNEALFSLPANQRYSFVFNGNPQELDHAFLSTAAQARFISFAYGRGNTDAPAREETQPLITVPAIRVLYASDHDGFVLRLDATANRQPTGTSIVNQIAMERDVISRDVAASFSDPDSDTLTCSATGLPSGLSISSSCVISGTIAIGAASGSPYTVTVRATDPAGLFFELSFLLTVNPLPEGIFANGFE